jgi:hypothetical protein
MRLREVEFGDCEAVTALKVRYNLKPDSPANWQRLWKHNPALGGFKSVPIGWVLERGQDLVGYIGNIPLRCYYNGKPLTAATTHALVVQPSCRAYTGGLVSAFARQKGIDLLLATSAGHVSSKIFQAYKGTLLPQADFSTALFWVLDPQSFIGAMQEKFAIRGPLAAIGKTLGGALLRAEQAFRRRRPRAGFQKCEIRELAPSEIGDDFEEFWRRKLASTSRLIADRSAATLRWHFDVPDDQRRPVVLRCDCSGRMAGYAVLVTNVAEGNLRKARVADILVEDEHSFVPGQLIAAAFEYSRRSNHHVFEVIGYPAAIRRVCHEWKPYRRKHSDYLFKAADPTLHSRLSHEDAWYPTPYDGDATLMPEYALGKADDRYALS